MNTEKIYSGLVKNVRLIDTNPFGIKTYAIDFKSTTVFYQISSKQNLYIQVGRKIYFKGVDQLGAYFMITELVDAPVELPKGSGFTKEQEEMMMSEAQYNQMMSEYLHYES